MPSVISNPEVVDFLVDASNDGLQEELQKNYQLDGSRFSELNKLVFAVLKGEIELETFPEFIQKAFGLDSKTAESIAADLAGYRLLPLKQFVPGVETWVKKWGGNPSDYSKDHIVRVEVKPQTIALRVLKERGVELPATLEKRYLFLSEQLLEGEKDQDWFETFAMRDVAIGGLEISKEAAQNLSVALINERKEVHEEVGVPLEVHQRSSIEQNASDSSQSKTKVLTEAEQSALLNELERQLGELQKKHQERVRLSRPEKKITELPKAQVKEVTTDFSAEELDALEAQLDAIDLGEDNHSAHKKKVQAMPIKIEGDLISDAEKEEVAKQPQGRRPKVELTSEQEKELDALWPIFKKKRISRIAMFDFAKTYLVGMRSERQMEGLMRDRYHLDESAVEHVMDGLMKVKVTLEKSQLQQRQDNLPDLAGIQAMEEEVLSKRYAVMTKKANVMGKGLAKDSAQTQVSASRSKEQELMIQADRISADKLKEAIVASKPKPVAPKLSKRSAPPSETRQKITDINYKPELIGPVDELGTMAVEDFKRMATSPEEAVNKLMDKVEELAEIAPSKRIEGILAWRKSPVYKVYRSMMQESLSTGVALSEIASNRRNKGEETLTPAEIKALIKANKMLQF